MTDSDTMFEFSKLCKAVEEMDPSVYAEVITRKSADIIAALSAITQSGKDGVTIYLTFILTSIAADAKLDESEYRMIRPMLEKAMEREITYEVAKKFFTDAGLDNPKEYKRAVDQMVDLLGMVSMDLKRDIVIVCMMVCAVDGKISSKEKKWIKQLIR